ncbi:MAG: hypothetical protein HRU13_05180 [Phycisphaerales bacterium]|nr:hypothetical protein [Phycisphaerales bacterium]
MSIAPYVDDEKSDHASDADDSDEPDNSNADVNAEAPSSPSGPPREFDEARERLIHSYTMKLPIAATMHLLKSQGTMMAVAMHRRDATKVAQLACLLTSLTASCLGDLYAAQRLAEDLSVLIDSYAKDATDSVERRRAAKLTISGLIQRHLTPRNGESMAPTMGSALHLPLHRALGRAGRLLKHGAVAQFHGALANGRNMACDTYRKMKNDALAQIATAKQNLLQLRAWQVCARSDFTHFRTYLTQTREEIGALANTIVTSQRRLNEEVERAMNACDTPEDRKRVLKLAALMGAQLRAKVRIKDLAPVDPRLMVALDELRELGARLGLMQSFLNGPLMWANLWNATNCMLPNTQELLRMLRCALQFVDHLDELNADKDKALRPLTRKVRRCLKAAPILEPDAQDEKIEHVEEQKAPAAQSEAPEAAQPAPAAEDEVPDMAQQAPDDHGDEHEHVHAPEPADPAEEKLPELPPQRDFDRHYAAQIDAAHMMPENEQADDEGDADDTSLGAAQDGVASNDRDRRRERGHGARDGRRCHSLATRAWALAEYAAYAENSATGFKPPARSPFARFVSTSEGRDAVIRAILEAEATYVDQIGYAPMDLRDPLAYFKRQLDRYVHGFSHQHTHTTTPGTTPCWRGSRTS